MRIRCPHCGERGHEEFAYHGDAAPARPHTDDAAAWHAHVYLRDNPAGPHRELWHHAAGCRTWLVVTRDIATHAIDRVEDARSVALARALMHRLPTGGLIDRDRRLAFRFDGKPFAAMAGDTLASALLANGVRMVARSFKYHRPRGVLSAGPEEPNALVELRGGARREPNTPATVIELHDGLEAFSQNRFPSLRFDLLAVNGLLAPLLSAGFYYKTFMWPASFWERIYEPLIRHAAGLGRAAPVADPDAYEKAHAFCDLLVIGSGPAGLAAALAAGRSGARVILCEADFRLGGRCLAESDRIDGTTSSDWAAQAAAMLAALPDARIMIRTTVTGVYDGGTYAAVERVADHHKVPPPHQPRQRLWRIVARRCVLAAGAIERPAVFTDNDRPGIMLAGSVRAYLNRYAVAPGRRAVLFAGNDDAMRTAVDWAAAGIEVAALVDPRPESSPALRRAAAACGAPVVSGVVTRAHSRLLRAVTVATTDGREQRIDCDLLAVSGGWTPSLHLTCHLGGRPVWDAGHDTFLPGRLPPGMAVAGSAAGQYALSECLAAGTAAGAAAAAACGFTLAAGDAPEADSQPETSTPLRLRHAYGAAFVDFQNDVTTKDIALAAREGFSAVEHLKRYTTLGMATDQGKTANVNALALMAELTGRAIDTVGTTTFRPPYTPVAIGVLAGPHRGKDFRPTRLPPSHGWAEAQGAVFTEAGPWLRALCFPRPGDADALATVNREVEAVRSTVGVCDVSTLGKIELHGPDAGGLLDLVYANSISNLAVGRARYGIMLREDGFVLDDGTVSRLAAEHWLVTTTTANAGRVLQHLEFCLQWLWPVLDVQCLSVTEQWAQFSIAGPQARALVRRIVDEGHDLSNAGFPYMAAAAVRVCGGVKARLFRISFSGELAYELAVPAGFGDAAIRRIAERGAVPYGTDALGTLRIEKGHAAGAELNGQTTARDLGLGRMMSSRKDYVGRVMAARPALLDPARPTLVGLKPVDRSARLRAGAHLLPQGRPATAEHDQGHVTSAAFSPALGHWIGLGLLANGPRRHGETVRAFDGVRDGETAVEICPPCFLDPEGERLRA